jgi:hypothetical protein
VSESKNERRSLTATVPGNVIYVGISPTFSDRVLRACTASDWNAQAILL